MDVTGLYDRLKSVRILTSMVQVMMYILRWDRDWIAFALPLRTLTDCAR